MEIQENYSKGQIMISSVEVKNKTKNKSAKITKPGKYVEEDQIMPNKATSSNAASSSTQYNFYNIILRVPIKENNKNYQLHITLKKDENNFNLFLITEASVRNIDEKITATVKRKKNNVDFSFICKKNLNDLFKEYH